MTGLPLAWTQRLALTGDSPAQPKRLRYRLVARRRPPGVPCAHGDLVLDARWPRRDALIEAFKRARALPAPA